MPTISGSPYRSVTRHQLSIAGAFGPINSPDVDNCGWQGGGHSNPARCERRDEPELQILE
jgi:hypothetical protein